MLKTFEELTKNEKWLKARNNLKRRDTDKEFDEKCRKEYLESLKKKVLTNSRNSAIIKKS